MAGRPKRPGPSHQATSGRTSRRSVASGSPPPPVVLDGEVHPGGDPVTWAQLALFVVAYGLHPVPEPEPEPVAEPEDPGRQLTLPGFPEPASPQDHLDAMRATLAARARPERKKRTA